MKSTTLEGFVKRWEEVLQGKIMHGYVSQVYDDSGKGRNAADVLRMMAMDALRLRELLEAMWIQEISPPKPPVSPMMQRLALCSALPSVNGQGQAQPTKARQP